MKHVKKRKKHPNGRYAVAPHAGAWIETNTDGILCRRP